MWSTAAVAELASGGSLSLTLRSAANWFVATWLEGCLRFYD